MLSEESVGIVYKNRGQNTPWIGRKTVRSILSKAFLCGVGNRSMWIMIGIFSTLCASAFAGMPSFAPVNPEYIDYVNADQQSTMMQKPLDPIGGRIPSFRFAHVPETINLPHSKATKSIQLYGAAAFPPSFDLRNQNKLTPVRNQGSSGSCWAFATIGSLESFFLPNTMWDFSENNLKNSSGFDIGPNSGGNRTMSAAYLARWSGPAAESDDPYVPSSTSSPSNLSPKAHVQDIIYIPDRTDSLDNGDIKQALINFGAVYTCYYHDDICYNPSTFSYCYNGTSGANHAVCIVGWDDTFDRNKFAYPPAGNGAFIVRNSWGPSWGQGGYFYISYYDSRIGTENAVYTGEPTSNYGSIYQYDSLGWTGNCGYGTNTAWFANVFTAQKNDQITAASFYSPSEASSYEIRVYLSPSSGPIASSGPVVTKTGIVDYAGYHTVKLDSPAPITANQPFSVVVKLTTPGYNYPISIERPIGGYCSKAVASTGQSFISNDGQTWRDMTSVYSGTNVCLKAFTGQSTTTPPGRISVGPSSSLSASGYAGGPFNPSSIKYTISNTGGQAVNWTAQKSQSWLSLSAVSGTLTPGKSTTVTVSIGSSANSLAAGSYSDTVNFTNTTNGLGNASFGASLKVSPVPDYHASKTTYAWIDPTSHTAVSAGDDTSTTVSLPFAFKFYGNSYSTLYVGSNGLLGFVNSGLNSPNELRLPSTSKPNTIICPYWDNLNPAAGGSIRRTVLGSSPNRTVVISWVGVPHHDVTSAKFTFQAILYEGSGNIVFQYKDVAAGDVKVGGGLSATVGVENGSSSKACLWSYHGSPAINNGDALLFVYQ